jgi:hypothetical protein
MTGSLVADHLKTNRQPTQTRSSTYDLTAAFDGRSSADEWPESPDQPGSPNPTPLPIDVLPQVLQRHAVSVADAIQVPTDLPCLLSLSCVSAALAGRVEIDVRPGWREPVGIYTACILPPASRKSPCYRAMVAPVSEWEANAIRQTAPADGRLLAGDITPEEMVCRMAAQGGRLAILEPEPGPLQLLAGHYSKSARLNELKKAWSGETLIVDRVGRATVRVPRPALTLALMLQPGVIESLPHSATFRHEGVLGRILWAAPPHNLGHRLTGAAVPPINEEAENNYRHILHTLLDTSPAGWTEDGMPRPHVLPLTSEAIEVLHAFEAQTEMELADGGRYEEILDWAGKMAGQSVRVAALLALAERVGAGMKLMMPIDGCSMAGAVKLLQALGTHALHVLGCRGDGYTADLCYLLQRLRDLPIGTTESELRAATRGRASIKADAAIVSKLLDDLEARRCARRRIGSHEGQGRPKSPMVDLHPALRPTREVIEI